MVSLNIYKNSTNKFGRKTGFKIENEIEDRDQSIPKFIGILTQVFCTFGPNLVILAWTGDELSCRQAQNGVTFDFEVKFDLEGQGQSPPKTIGILTKVFYTYGPNLAILAWTGDELSRGQASHQPHHKSIRPNSLPTRTPHHLHNTTLKLRHMESHTPQPTQNSNVQILPTIPWDATQPNRHNDRHQHKHYIYQPITTCLHTKISRHNHH